MLIVDRERVKDRFASYCAHYDIEDTKVRLKVEHTYRVAELAEKIARSLDLDEGDVDIAWLLGMLHDIGRFEQLRRFNTFIDSSFNWLCSQTGNCLQDEKSSACN